MLSVDLSADTLVFWAFAVAWLIVLGLILFGAVPRVVREGLRIAKRVSALVNDSPLPKQIATAEADVRRIQAAIDAGPALGRRAQRAVHIIRTTPLVPRAVVAIAVRVRHEVRAFQTTRGA